MDHFIKVCEFCGTVIAQCRCMDCNKEKRFGLCAKCAEERNVQDPTKLLEYQGEGYTITIHASPTCPPQTLIALGDMIGYLIKHLEQERHPPCPIHGHDYHAMCSMCVKAVEQYK